MDRKTIFITGATQGLGKETAIGLAKQGHRLVLHGRNNSKLHEVSDEIKTLSGNNNIDTIIADLSLLADTKRMTDEFLSRYEKLDVLINNAGMYPAKKRETTREGVEESIAVNLLSPFLIMQSMKPALLKSESARIINVTSMMHRYAGRPDFSDIQFERRYSQMRIYGIAKLYLIWVTRLLSDMLKKRGVNNVTVNALHPGAVATYFGQEAYRSLVFKHIYKVVQNFMDTPEDGAKAIIYLATSPEVENITGEYFNKLGKIDKVNDRYWSLDNGKLIVDYCMEVIEQALAK